MEGRGGSRSGEGSNEALEASPPARPLPRCWETESPSSWPGAWPWPRPLSEARPRSWGVAQRGGRHCQPPRDSTSFLRGVSPPGLAQSSFLPSPAHPRPSLGSQCDSHSGFPNPQTGASLAGRLPPFLQPRPCHFIVIGHSLLFPSLPRDLQAARGNSRSAHL